MASLDCFAKGRKLRAFRNTINQINWILLSIDFVKTARRIVLQPLRLRIHSVTFHRTGSADRNTTGAWRTDRQTDRYRQNSPMRNTRNPWRSTDVLVLERTQLVPNSPVPKDQVTAAVHAALHGLAGESRQDFIGSAVPQTRNKSWQIAAGNNYATTRINLEMYHSLVWVLYKRTY